MSLDDTFRFDVAADVDNVELGASDPKHTPSYRVERRYRPSRSQRDRERAAKAERDESCQIPSKRYYNKLDVNAPVVASRMGQADVEIAQGEGREFVPIADDAGEQDNEAAPRSEEQLWLERNRHLNELVRYDPHCIANWWQLVLHQDYCVKQSKAATLERKCAILEAALDANPTCDVLAIVYMRFCGQFVSQEEIHVKWQRTLQRSPSSIRLYQHYLRSQLSSFGTLTIESMREYLFGMLARYSSASLQNSQGHLLYTLSILCWFERGSGYNERSTAYAQAVIEYNMFCPIQLRQSDPETRLHWFELFWESEVPRIGDRHARGWTDWFDQQMSQNFDDIERQEPSEVSDMNMDALEPTSIQGWLRNELNLSHSSFVPLRGGGDSMEDQDLDLDRIVTFDDVRPVLFTCDSQFHLGLIDALLSSIGLPDCFLSRNRVISSEERSIESFRLIDLWDFQGFFVNGIDPFTMKTSLEDEMAAVNRLTPTAMDTVLSSCLDARIDRRRARFCLIALDLFLSLQQCPSPDILRVTRLIIESAGYGLKSAVKSTKQFLNEHRSDMQLCHVYALLEFRLGRLKAASKVYTMVLQSFADETDPKYFVLLWSMYQLYDMDDQDWSVDNLPARQHILLAIAEGRFSKLDASAPIARVRLARARNQFLTRLTGMSNDAAWWTRDVGSIFPISPGLSIALGALHLEYLIGGIIPAIEFFQRSILPIVPTNGSEFEYAWKTQVRLVMSHYQRNPTSPSKPFLELADQAVSACPFSYSIWSALVDSNLPMPSLRRSFDAVVAQLELSGLINAPGNLYLFAIATEIARDPALISTSSMNRIHRLLERAIQGDAGGQCLMWRIYCSIEQSRPDGQSAKVFQRAVASCAWSKAIWIHGMQSLGDKLTSNECLSFITLMGDKGIRLHTQPPIHVRE